jgi:hypothetical protein
MAQTQLSDIIEPGLFSQYVVQKTTELSAFFRAGIITQTDLINQLTQAASNSFTIPYWNPLASTEPNVGSDNPASTSTPLNIDAGSQVGIKQRRNQSWSTMDLVAVVAGSDPMGQIVNGVAGYWARALNQNLIACVNGVIADNEANDSGDMVVDVTDDAAGAPGAATLIQASVVIDGWATLGDHMGEIAGIAMHSVPYTTLQKADLITFQPTSGQDVGFGTYLGKTVIVDDSLPAAAQTNQTWYTSVLFGNGAFGYGEGTPTTPTEVDRTPASGDGEGQETLFSRRHFCIHPGGFAWQGASMAGTTPTNAELATATNWDRVFDQKNIPLAFLKTNG